MSNIVKTSNSVAKVEERGGIGSVLPEYRSLYPSVDARAKLRNAKTIEEEVAAVYNTVMEWLKNGRLAEEPASNSILPSEIFAQWCKSRLGTANEFDIRDRLQLFVAFAGVAIQQQLRKAAIEQQRAQEDQDEAPLVS